MPSTWCSNGAGLLDHHLGELDNGGNGDYERQRAQVLEPERHQQVVVDDVAGTGGDGEDEGGRRPMPKAVSSFLETPMKGHRPRIFTSTTLLTKTAPTMMNR
jgi:hypothetical protein